jgi:hypothetical protein
LDPLAVIVAVTFWAFLLSGGVLVALSGDRPAQRFLGAILIATLLTGATDLMIAKVIAPFAYLAIDASLLGLAIYFVVMIDRFWPVWFAGFQTITVASELSRLIFSGLSPERYADVGGFWAVPAFLSMVAGVTLDRRISTMVMADLETKRSR